jgi:hypothetical protein
MAAAAPVLAGLGLSGARTDAGRTVGSVRLVTANPVVGGLPTAGWFTQLGIGDDGKISMGYGRLAPLGANGSYRVESADAAFKQLAARATAGVTDRGPACSAPLPPPTATTPGDDRKLPRSMPCAAGDGRPTEVRGATFGLSPQFVSGTQTLVPSWLFDTAPPGVSGTAVVAQSAVPPSDLPTGAGGAPSPAPGVNPGGPVVTDPAMPSDPRPPLRVPVAGYHASGTTLTLTFWGGLCDTYKAAATESSSQVRVTLTATPKKPARVCPMIARSFTVSVRLDAPLGHRTVVNAEDGQPVRGQ